MNPQEKKMTHFDTVDKPSITLCFVSVLLQIVNDPAFSSFSKYLTLFAVTSTVVYNTLRIIKEIKNK